MPHLRCLTSAEYTSVNSMTLLVPTDLSPVKFGIQVAHGPPTGILVNSEAHSEFCQTCKVKLFAKLVKD